MVRLAAIVEGDGECAAVPVLIRRIALTLDPGLAPNVKPVIRVPGSRLAKEGELERTVELAARKLGRRGGILILVDCDDGCPATRGPALLRRAQAACSDMAISVVLAKREYEAWFLAAAESLQGRRGLPVDLLPPPAPESIRGAKEWLTRRMPRGRGYAETTDQPALTECFDLDAARRADSFDKCYREVVQLINRLRGDLLR